MSNKKNVWSQQDEERLFEFHKTIGNQWSNIALKLGTKDQNSIKNKFYSTLRKGIRKINKYLFDIKKKADPQRYKSIKPIQQIFISKLMAVFDENYDEKYEVKPLAIQLASDIQQKLVTVARSDQQYLKPSKAQYGLEEELVQNIMIFNKNCKKRKGKKKSSEKGTRIEEEEEDNEQIEQSQIIQDKIKHQCIKIEEQKIGININPPPPKQVSDQQKLVQYSSFLKGMQKKQSTSKVVRIDNFSNLANQFIKNCIQPEYDPLFQNENITLSGYLRQNDENWQFESNGSKRQPKQLIHLTEVSPYPNDTSSPYSFANIMKAKNITGSNMFSDKISCASAEILQNSSLYAKPQPQPTSNTNKQNKAGEFLIKSADLKLQINQQNGSASKHQNQMYRSCIVRKKGSSQFDHQVNFEKQYAFQLNMAPFTSSSLFKSFNKESDKRSQKTYN